MSTPRTPFDTGFDGLNGLTGLTGLEQPTPTPTLTEDERRRIELAILAAEARLALDAVSPLVALLPEPARSVVMVLERIVKAL